MAAVKLAKKADLTTETAARTAADTALEESGHVIGIANFPRLAPEVTDDGRWDRALADVWVGGTREGYALKIDQDDPFEMVAAVILTEKTTLVADGVPEFTQDTWGEPCIETMPSADDCVIPTFMATNVPGSNPRLRRRVGAQFQGGTTGERCSALNVHSSGLRCGGVIAFDFYCAARLQAWTSGAQHDEPGIYRTDNRIGFVTFDGVDFGLLYGGQDGLRVGSVSGRYMATLQGIIAAPHAVYQADGAGNEDAQIGSVTTWDGPPSHSQIIAMTGVATSGTWRLLSPFAAEYTDPIAFNATAEDIQDAINALPSISGDPDREVFCNGGFSSSVAAGYDGPLQAGWSVSLVWENMPPGDLRPALFEADDASLVGATIAVTVGSSPGCPVQIKGSRGKGGHCGPVSATNCVGGVLTGATAERFTVESFEGKELRGDTAPISLDGQYNRVLDFDFDMVEPQQPVVVAGRGNYAKGIARTCWNANGEDVTGDTSRSYQAAIGDEAHTLDLSFVNDDPAGWPAATLQLTDNEDVSRAAPGGTFVGGALENTVVYGNGGCAVRVTRDTPTVRLVRSTRPADATPDIVEPVGVTKAVGYTESLVTNLETLIVKSPPLAAPSLLDNGTTMATFDGAGAAAAVLTAANRGLGARVRARQTGMLKNLNIFVGVSSGNIVVAAVGLSGATRTVLWTTGSVACPAAGLRNAMSLGGDPDGVEVEEDSFYELWLSADNTTASFSRILTVAAGLVAMGADEGLLSPAITGASPNGFTQLSVVDTVLSGVVEGSVKPWIRGAIV